MLYEFCASHDVPHRKCGKLIVATNEAELDKIRSIEVQGGINGVEGLELIGGNAARTLEPELSCLGALLSPETGIIDGHRYMLALRGDFEDAGGAIALKTPVTGARRKNGQWQVTFGGNDGGTFAFDAIANCAGLRAQSVARTMEDYPAARVPRLVLGKGNYFAYAGKPVFSRLIYPTPIVGGLGVHVTLDMAGRMRFGPDVEWVDAVNYDVDPTRAHLFYARIRTYWPGLPNDSLSPDYSGIRPKLSGPGEPQGDFLIDTPAQHGLPGLVQMFGIESPGLTSSLSLGEAVAGYLES
jgi:L-2-hydroxyglutarate oxidase LhgO